MNILVLNGSPRPKGNTMRMLDAFSAGAAQAGHLAVLRFAATEKFDGFITAISAADIHYLIH